MNAIAVLVADLQSRGIVLSLDGEQIRFRAPPGVLTDTDKSALSARRGEVAAFLQAREAGRGLRAVKGRAGPLTASMVQEMWWRFAGGPDEGKPMALNIGIGGRFRDTDAAAVTRAVQNVIARHDTLRTHIAIRGDELELSLNDAASFQVEQEDLTRAAPDAAMIESRVRDYCALLNPVEGQWQGRAKIFALPGNSVLLAMSFSHIIADAGSRNIIFDELQDLLAGQDVAARPFVPYNDFSLAERDVLAGPQGDTLIAYWRRWYADSPVMLSPVEKTPLRWGAGIRIVNNFTIPGRVLRAVDALAAQLRVTPFAIHLTLFCLALGRWSKTQDFTIRILGDKRTALELSGTVGLMFCADPVAVQAPEDADFETVLRGIVKAYDASLALRLPALHFYPPEAVRPGIAPPDHRVKIPAVFNYYSAGTQREREAGDAAPDGAQTMPWPPRIERMPPAAWTRPSAPVFLHLVDYGHMTEASLHFFAGVVSEAEQQAFIETLLALYSGIAPS